MSKTVAFHLQKGGVGKTTISGTLACQSAMEGFRTLVIDCDPQGNLSSWFLSEPPKYELSDVLQGRCYVGNAIVVAPGLENLSILPTFGIGGTLKNYSETKLAEEPFILQDLVDELAKLKKNMRAAVKHNKIIINSYDERIRQHRDIFSAAEASGRFLVYRIPVDPLFRKAQEAGKVPQLYKVRGRGLKVATQQAIKDLDSSIWR